MKEKVMDLQHDLKDSAGKIWLAGLGALSMAGEEGSKLFQNLVEKGKEFDKREHAPTEAVKRTVDSARDRAGDVLSRFEEMFNDKVAFALTKMGVPTREEIQGLTARVEALMASLEKLETKAETKGKSEAK
jgi:poly(hydroxyalkanoate) granule-associated protein